MSSGSLPLTSYHRASYLGEGSFGSVVTVYNDDGQEFALKLFLTSEDNDEDNNYHYKDYEDEDNENEDDDVSIGDDEYNCVVRYPQQRRKQRQQPPPPLEIGALREISCLRIFRKDNRHDNIIELHDVQTEWNEESVGGGGGGAGTSGCLGMAMPLGQWGSLADNITKKTFTGYPKTVKIGIAHGLISAVCFLHENGVLHRDIKSDNIIFSNDNMDEWKPILIDFSLAKPIDGTMWGCQDWNEINTTNKNNDRNKNKNCASTGMFELTELTGEVGTVVYMAPEIVNQDPYGKPADMYSVGVVLLELLQDALFTAEKSHHGMAQINARIEELPESNPFPDLIRNLLQTNPDLRFTARQALSHPVFTKFGFPPPSSIPRIIDIATALPYQSETEEDTNEIDENTEPTIFLKNSGKLVSHCKKTTRQDANTKKYVRRMGQIDKILNELGSVQPWTRVAALEYSQQLELVEDDIDDIGSSGTSQSLLDCCILAHRFFELEYIDLDHLAEQDKGLFRHWTIEQYCDDEGTIFMLLDFCLYPRSLLLGGDS